MKIYLRDKKKKSKTRSRSHGKPTKKRGKPF